MPSFARLTQSASATATAGGACTITFAPVPQGLVWRGSVFVDQSNAAATWRVTVSGVPWGSTAGGTALLVEATSGDVVQVVGSNVTPTTRFTAWLNGSSVDEQVPAEVGYFNPFPGPPTSGATEIQTQTLTATAASFSFVNIPQAFVNLILLGSFRSAVAAATDNMGFRINNDSGTNYSYQGMTSTGAANNNAFVNNATSIGGPIIPGATATANLASQVILNLPNYSQPTLLQGVTLQSGWADHVAATGRAELVAGVWANTGAVTRLDVILATGPFAIGSSCTLLGF